MATRKRLLDAVLFGGAAALGSTVVALIFRVLDRKLDAHNVKLTTTSFQTLDPALQNVCVYPSTCTITVVQ